MEDGYNISQIGSKEYSTILGFHSFPDFMYKSNLSEVEKIIAFNHYVKNIEITEKADVIIIGIPFGIMPFDNQFNNNFGVMLYEVSNAIVPDYVILSMTFREYDSQDIDEIKKIMKYKFGCEVDCFNLSNTRIDWNGSKEFLKKIYTKISTKLVDSKANNLKRMGYPVINIFNDIDKNLLYTNLINSLSDNEKITWL